MFQHCDSFPYIWAHDGGEAAFRATVSDEEI